jgi:hypothetical protein
VQNNWHVRNEHTLYLHCRLDAVQRQLNGKSGVLMSQDVVGI